MTLSIHILISDLMHRYDVIVSQIEDYINVIILAKTCWSTVLNVLMQCHALDNSTYYRCCAVLTDLMRLIARCSHVECHCDDSPDLLTRPPLPVISPLTAHHFLARRAQPCHAMHCMIVPQSATSYRPGSSSSARKWSEVSQ